jgi:hypothetical protein
MVILSDCGIDVGPIVRAINSGEPVADEDAKINYRYDGWTLLHCAACAGRVDVVRQFVKYGASLDVEASNPHYPNFRTPRTILAARYPALLEEFEEDISG